MRDIATAIGYVVLSLGAIALVLLTAATVGGMAYSAWRRARALHYRWMLKTGRRQVPRIITTKERAQQEGRG